MKSFLTEVSRLDLSNKIDLAKVDPDYYGAFFLWKESDSYNEDDYPDWDSYDEDEIDFQISICSTRKLALKHDNPKGRFSNNHLWYVYFDRYAYNDPDSVKSIVTIESDLANCLAILELDNVFYFEAMVFSKYLDFCKKMSLKEILDHYYKKIVLQCYRTGKFETPLWKIENNIISPRNK